MEHLPAAQAASLLATTATEATVGGDATLVTVTVVVPDDPIGRGFPVRAAAGTGPLGTGTIYATVAGHSGAPMVVRFVLDIP